MKPIQTLLAATDFSATARRAEERAALLAQRHDARLVLLHCLPGLELAELRARLASAGSSLRARAQSALQERADALTRAYGIGVRTHLMEGQPHREIELAAAAVNADLVVVGAAGEHPLREFFLGATAERVVRACPAPVLVVRSEARAPYERVLAALDLSPQSAATLEAARRVAPDADLTLGHAFEVPFEGKLRFAGVSEEDIQRYRREDRARAMAALNALAVNGGRAGIRVEHGMPESVLLHLIRETAADLVVCGKHGASEFVDLLLGSVTKHLLREANLDVLVVPPPAAPLDA